MCGGERDQCGWHSSIYLIFEISVWIIICLFLRYFIRNSNSIFELKECVKNIAQNYNSGNNFGTKKDEIIEDQINMK